MRQWREAWYGTQLGGRNRTRKHQADDRQHHWWYAVELDCSPSGSLRRGSRAGHSELSSDNFHTDHPFRVMSVAVRPDRTRNVLDMSAKCPVGPLHR